MDWFTTILKKKYDNAKFLNICFIYCPQITLTVLPNITQGALLAHCAFKHLLHNDFWAAYMYAQILLNLKGQIDEKLNFYE